MYIYMCEKNQLKQKNIHFLFICLSHKFILKLFYDCFDHLTKKKLSKSVKRFPHNKALDMMKISRPFYEIIPKSLIFSLDVNE